MAETAQLTLSFLRLHPRSAAAVLESLPPENAAAFLADVPPRLAAPVWTGMLPYYAARALGICREDYATGVLAAMAATPGAAVLRQMPEGRREDLLARLPGRTTFALRLLLRYPSRTVGAWMEPAVASIPAGETVLDTWIRLRRDAEALDRYLYVVDREHQRLLGRVDTVELLRAEGEMLVDRLLVGVPTALAARAELAAAVADAAWRDCDPLPVTARNGAFLGVAHYAVLCHGERVTRDQVPTPVFGDSLLELVEAYWSGLARLIEGPFAKRRTQRSQPNSED